MRSSSVPIILLQIEFPHPDESARARILQIHSRKVNFPAYLNFPHTSQMNVSPDVNFDELARCTDDFNGAQLKVRAGMATCGHFCALQAVAVEAGMLALRREATQLGHEDFMEGIIQV